MVYGSPGSREVMMRLLDLLPAHGDCMKGKEQLCHVYIGIALTVNYHNDKSSVTYNEWSCCT